MILQALYLKLLSIVTSFHLTCIEVKQTEFVKQQVHVMQVPREKKIDSLVAQQLKELKR